MLGSDSFAFETPNVVDPGDLPPSRPRRQSNKSSLSSPTSSTHHSSDDEEEVNHNNKYKEEHYSSTRLLRDIGDLDLSPTSAVDAAAASSSSTNPYDPYQDKDGEDYDDDDVEQNYHHSLPTVEEARMYATSLLSESNLRQNSNNRRGDSNSAKSSPSSFNRTVKLDSPSLSSSSSPSSSGNLVRRRFLSLVARFCIVLILMIVTVAIGVAMTASRRNKSATTNTMGGPDDITTPTPRLIEIVDFLSANGISHREDLESLATPQGAAATWMANIDQLQYRVPEKLESDQRFVQRYVLATFYFAMNGINWQENLNFLSSQDECAWYAEVETVHYVAKKIAYGVDCDKYMNVQDIFMPKNNLRGSLPSELRFLSQLEMLSLSYNHITGSFPDEYKHLTNLNYLDLKYNIMTGALPEWIGDLDALEVLGLANNKLEGTVPPSYGTLGRLKTLALDDNALTGSIDFANHLTNLEYFYADRNLLTGQVDDQFLVNLRLLRELDLGSNDLKGQYLPVHLLQHPTLNVLDLAEIKVSGAFPELTTDNDVLRYLSLRRLGLSGALPSSSLHKLMKLSHLDLFGNDLSGTLPSEMRQMSSLTYLFLGENNFSPTSDFPPFVADLVNLRELSMPSTNLGGNIPSWLNYAKGLKLLDLSHNNLAGTVPQEVWDLPDLTYLLLHNNALTGEVPSSIEGAGKLEIVSLHKNSQLTGDVNHICEANTDIVLIGTDCGGSIACSEDCCPECCSNDGDECFEDEIATFLSWYEGMWEYNYTRSTYSFDPAIASQGVFKVVSEDKQQTPPP